MLPPEQCSIVENNVISTTANCSQIPPWTICIMAHSGDQMSALQIHCALTHETHYPLALPQVSVHHPREMKAALRRFASAGASAVDAALLAEYQVKYLNQKVEVMILFSDGSRQVT